MDAFVTLVIDRATDEFEMKLWDAMVSDLKTREQVVSVLRFAARLGRRWTFAGAGPRIAALLIRGLEIGWSRITERDGASAAVRLVLALEPPLRGQDAAMVRDRFMGIFDSAQITKLDEAFNAFAVSAALGSAPADGGAALTEELIAQEDRATKANATAQLVGAFAMLCRSATGEAKERLHSMLRSRVSRDAARGGWWEVERVLAAGVEVDGEVADAYLGQIADRLDSLQRQAGTGTLSGGYREVPALTTWSAAHGSELSRRKALRAAISFLTEDGHLLIERTSWISFIAELARATPDLVAEATSALMRVVRNELKPVGGIDEYSHPLSGGFRVVGNSPDRIRSHAVSWLATLLSVTDQKETEVILQALREAAVASSPDMRLGALRGATWAYRTLRQIKDIASRRKVTFDELRLLLVSLAADHVERIALEAFRALANGLGLEDTTGLLSHPEES